MSDSLMINAQTIDTTHSISVLRKYMTVVERGMQETHASEKAELEAQRPKSDDEEENGLFWNEQCYLQNLFEQSLFPTMRYSFIIFLHMIFETELRGFCAAIVKERKLPLGFADLQGSPIEKCHKLLTKVAGVPISDFTEWEAMRSIQKIRDCIVHTNGSVPESRDKDPLHVLVKKNIGLTIDNHGRLTMTREFCLGTIDELESLFNNLFRSVGWHTLG